MVSSSPYKLETKLTHFRIGLGALISPLVATQFAQFNHWSFHYLVSLGLALSNVVILWVVFRLKSQDGEHNSYLISFRVVERVQIVWHKSVHHPMRSPQASKARSIRFSD